MPIKIMKFGASWCEPCQRYAPVFDNFVRDTEYEVHKYDVDTDIVEAASRRISKIPCTIIEGPRGSKRRTGELDSGQLKALIDSVS